MRRHLRAVTPAVDAVDLHVDSRRGAATYFLPDDDRVTLSLPSSGATSARADRRDVHPLDQLEEDLVLADAEALVGREGFAAPLAAELGQAVGDVGVTGRRSIARPLSHPTRS